MDYNQRRKGRCDKRFAQFRFTSYYGRNRHLAEWRFLLFTLIVTVHFRTWNVNVIGMTITPSWVVWQTACRCAAPGAPPGAPWSVSHNFTKKSMKNPCSKAGIDKSHFIRYNEHRERALRQAVCPVSIYFILWKKPSLGRVAVSAFYSDRYCPFQNMERQCNWHDHHPLLGGVANRLPLCSARCFTRSTMVSIP